MLVQKIVDGAVAGRMPDAWAALRSWMFSISPAPAALAKHANKAFSAESVMFSPALLGVIGCCLDEQAMSGRIR
jgi:hypothetical protein